MMKLLCTRTSPYGRIVRIQILEAGLQEQIEQIMTVTRVPDSPVLEYNPTGKIPCLVLDDGTVLSEARHVVAFIDEMHDGEPFLPLAPSLAERAFDGLVTGMLDGVAVWGRELRRPEHERSPNIIAQEHRRVIRCLDYLENQAASFEQSPSFSRVTLAICIASIIRGLDVDVFAGRGALENWYRTFIDRAAFAATEP